MCEKLGASEINRLSLVVASSSTSSTGSVIRRIKTEELTVIHETGASTRAPTDDNVDVAESNRESHIQVQYCHLLKDIHLIQELLKALLYTTQASRSLDAV